MTLATPATQETREQMLARLRAPLTERRALFVEEYARNGGNGTQAARVAGYGAGGTDDTVVLRAAASRLLTNENVLTYLGALTASERNERVLDAQQLAERLSAIVEGDLEAPIVTKDGMVWTVPTHSDRIKAAETLAKIRGYLAPIKLDVTLEIKDAGLAWIGAVLSIIQAKFDLSDQEIEALLPELPAMKVGNRQEIKIIDME